MVAAELASLGGARVQKAWAPGPSTVVLELRLPGRNVLVLLEAGSGTGRAQVIETRPPSPERPIAFQGLLRSQLENARLSAVARVAPSALRLTFQAKDGERSLGLELEPHGGLLVLLDDASRVRGASPTDKARERGLLRGMPWEPPGHDRGGDARFTPHAGADFPVSAAIGNLYGVVSREVERGSARQRLAGPLRAAAKKLERTLAKVGGDLERTRQAEGYQRFGALLMPMVARVPRGARSARVVEYGAEGPVEVEVPLLPHLSARENAERYFHLHRRLTRSVPLIEARRRKLSRTLERCQALLDELSRAPDAAAVDALETAARLEGLIGSHPAGESRPSAPQAARRPFREFTSASGKRIWVGRGARDNDALTFKLARGNDLWLHARGRTGSHVIVPGLGAEPPDEATLLDAALLAAHFSSGRGELVVDVAATRRKYVQKGKGAAAGAVRYSQERNVALRLDEARLERLLATETKP